MYVKFLALLEQKKVTCYKVSKDTGIPTTTFYDWKSGRSKPKVDKLKILADYFGVTIEYFLNDDKSQKEIR